MYPNTAHTLHGTPRFPHQWHLIRIQSCHSPDLRDLLQRHKSCHYKLRLALRCRCHWRLQINPSLVYDLSTIIPRRRPHNSLVARLLWEETVVSACHDTLTAIRGLPRAPGTKATSLFIAMDPSTIRRAQTIDTMLSVVFRTA